MTVTSKVLFDAAYAGTSAGVLFTAGELTKVEAATVTNISTTDDVFVTVYAVPTGGSAVDSNAIVKAFRVRPAESYLLPEARGKTFEVGDSLQALADVGSRAVFHVTGIEITT